jgi:hypothetical protein
LQPTWDVVLTGQLLAAHMGCGVDWLTRCNPHGMGGSCQRHPLPGGDIRWRHCALRMSRVHATASLAVACVCVCVCVRACVCSVQCAHGGVEEVTVCKDRMHAHLGVGVPACWLMAWPPPTLWTTHVELTDAHTLPPWCAAFRSQLRGCASSIYGALHSEASSTDQLSCGGCRPAGR